MLINFSIKKWDHIAKQGWRMLQNPSSLCAQVLFKAKYFPSAHRSRIRTTMDFVSASTQIGRQFRHYPERRWQNLFCLPCKNYIVIQSSANHIQQKENVSWDQMIVKFTTEQSNLVLSFVFLEVDMASGLRMFDSLLHCAETYCNIQYNDICTFGWKLKPLGFIGALPFDRWRRSGTPHSAEWSLQCQYSSSSCMLHVKQNNR